MNEQQHLITRPIDPYQQYQYQQYPSGYQQVNPQAFQNLQPQVIVVEKPAPVEVKPAKIEKSSFNSHTHSSNRFNPNLVIGVGLITVVFLFWGHKAQVADAKAESYKKGYENGLETAQLQIQQAIAAQKAAEAQSEGYKASLGQIQQVIAETNQPLIQLGVVNK